MPILQTEALTLRRRRMREADALVTLFCTQGGKVIASTKSVMKTGSRYAGITEPFNHLHVVLYIKSETQDIHTLTQAGLLYSYDALRQDITRLAYACCLAEWVDYLCDESQSNPVVWRLLLHAFERWSSKDPRHEDLFFYQWKLLADAGLAPQVHRCANTGVTSAKQWHYLPGTGAVSTEESSKSGVVLHQGSIQILRQLDASNDPPPVRFSKEQTGEIEALLQQHLEYHVGMRSRANLFLHQWKAVLNASQ